MSPQLSGKIRSCDHSFSDQMASTPANPAPAPTTASRKRRRPVSSRDLVFLCIGALAALGATNRHDLRPIIAERLAFVGPNTTTSAASSYSAASPGEDVVAQCSAKLKDVERENSGDCQMMVPTPMVLLLPAGGGCRQCKPPGWNYPKG